MFACQWLEDGRPVTTHHPTEEAAYEAGVVAAKTSRHVVIFEIEGDQA